MFSVGWGLALLNRECLLLRAWRGGGARRGGGDHDCLPVVRRVQEGRKEAGHDNLLPGAGRGLLPVGASAGRGGGDHNLRRPRPIL